MKNKVGVGLIIIGIVITRNISLVFSMGSRVEKNEKESVVQKEETPGLKDEKAVREKKQDSAIAQAEEEGKVQYEEYVPEVLIEGKWGKGPGEFGKTCHWSLSGDEKTYQPESIVADSKGNIYILDVVNNRIQKFNKKGKYIKSIKVDSYNGEVVGYHLKYKFENEISTAIVGINWKKDFKDFSIISAVEIRKPDKVLGINMVIDSKDNLYYYCIRGEKGEVWLFKDDRLVRKWEVAVIDRLYGLNLDAKDDLWLKNYNVLKKMKIKREKDKIKGKNGLEIIIQRDLNEKQNKVQFINKTKKTETSLIFKVEGKKETWISSTVPINKRGEIYLHHGSYLGKKREAYLDKYAPDGKLISIAKIPWEVDTRIRTIDNEGNVYQIKAEKEVKIIKWKRTGK